jgi:hypothetical protein
MKGFEEFRVYELPSDEAVTVLRILHGKHDIAVF